MDDPYGFPIVEVGCYDNINATGFYTERPNVEMCMAFVRPDCHKQVLILAETGAWRVREKNFESKVWSEWRAV